MKPILEVKNISKQFMISHEGVKTYASLRDSIRDVFSRKNKTTREEFWAVDDVSFDIYPGDSLAIIGRNGAGKSTLLKILSKITYPTKGEVIARGRIASLLEVGTGFHPELTGRENIFLNGSILGMKRAEIQKNFDAIVDFSGVEKFLDTQLKHYSSGMQLRLAFAVSAFLEPEVLIIDEVLAVGDAQFQKRCMDKMDDVSKSGRTVIIVSHNMNAIMSLCKQAVFLDKGKTDGVIDVTTAVGRYFEGTFSSNNAVEVYAADSKQDAGIREIRLLNHKGEPATVHETCNDLFVEVVWENVAGVPVNTNIELHNYYGIEVFCAFDTPIDWEGHKKSEKGVYTSRVKIPANYLKAGNYFFRIGLYSPVFPSRLLDIKLNVLSFNLIDPMDERCLARGIFTDQFENFVLLPALEWNYTKIN